MRLPTLYQIRIIFFNNTACFSLLPEKITN